MTEKRAIYEPYIKNNVKMLGEGFDMHRSIPTNGEFLFWGIGPIPGIFDALPK